MKSKRHEKIVELIRKYEIETQEELARKLEEEGFQVTQATVSRDIRQLNLSKMTGKTGRQKYVLISEPEHQMSEKYVGIFREAFLSMDNAQNILVIKTVPGMAMAAGAALDNLGWEEIVGCIAGDDTIMCAIRTLDDTYMVMEELRKILKK